MPPQHGLYTAIIAGIVIAVTGGSRFSISGPTAAFVVILYPVSQQFGLAGLLVATLISPDNRYNQQYLSNYATLQLVDRLSRVEGVGSVRIFGGRDYSMRVWIDPDRATALNLDAAEIVAAVRAQNVQVAAGAIGQPPYNTGGTAFQLNVQTEGRLTTIEQFGDIIVKRFDDGRLIRLSDVARIELGAQDYSVNAFNSGRPTVAVVVTQLPGSNALATAEAVRSELETAKRDFPPGLEYAIPYAPTTYIDASIAAVEDTLAVLTARAGFTTSPGDLATVLDWDQQARQQAAAWAARHGKR